MEQRIITANDIGFFQYVKRVWKFRSLIRILAVRDIKIRYSQTLLGVLWSVLQPLVAISIYTVFFYYVLGIKTGDVPYPLFVLPGIIGWFQFTNIINGAGMSLLENPDLIRKIEFPKMVLPLSRVLSGLLEVAITFGLMFLLMLIYGYGPSLKILLLPFFILLNIITGLSVSVWLAALTIRYRDFHHIIPYLVSFGIWVTPVFYPSTILPAGAEKYMFLNPVANIIAGFRWCMVDGPMLSYLQLLSFIPVLLLMLGGYRYFYKVEKTIVDHV
ncbi:MAG: ABC transporter permease [Flavobacteriales bacterium]|nr:ABC transporter permease [Flavobacteriales bacterium]